MVTGSFAGAVTFGSGEVNVTELVSVDQVDVFVARYAAGGSLVWAKQAGGMDIEGGQGIATFADGSSVVTGSFGGTATFGSGEAKETKLVSVGQDVFVARFNADGGF